MGYSRGAAGGRVAEHFAVEAVAAVIAAIIEKWSGELLDRYCFMGRIPFFISNISFGCQFFKGIFEFSAKEFLIGLKNPPLSLLLSLLHCSFLFSELSLLSTNLSFLGAHCSLFTLSSLDSQFECHASFQPEWVLLVLSPSSQFVHFLNS